MAYERVGHGLVSGHVGASAPRGDVFRYLRKHAQTCTNIRKHAIFQCLRSRVAMRKHCANTAQTLRKHCTNMRKHAQTYANFFFYACLRARVYMRKQCANIAQTCANIAQKLRKPRPQMSYSSANNAQTLRKYAQTSCLRRFSREEF